MNYYIQNKSYHLENQIDIVNEHGNRIYFFKISGRNCVKMFDHFNSEILTIKQIKLAFSSSFLIQKNFGKCIEIKCKRKKICFHGKPWNIKKISNKDYLITENIYNRKIAVVSRVNTSSRSSYKISINSLSDEAIIIASIVIINYLQKKIKRNKK